MNNKLLSLKTVSKRLIEIHVKKKKMSEKFALEEKEVKDRCPHNFVYEPDPSGNNDSGYYCSTCDKWVKNIT